MNPRERIVKFIDDNPIAIFMKGTEDRPECGFSKTVVDILRLFVPYFGSFNVLADPEVREEIKKFSNWPTIPQIYINKEFVGGCDIIKELFKNGELAEILGFSLSKESPKVEITSKAQEELKKAVQNEHLNVRLVISSLFQNDMYLDEANKNDFILNFADFSILIDNISALRANNITIDAGEEGFLIKNPNEPPKVKEITVQDLLKLKANNENFLLIDVRPKEERELSKIDFAKPLYEISSSDMQSLNKNTPIVFHCHFGSRSKKQAEKWRFFGFNNLYNLTGGIDAYSKVDESVKTY